MPRVRREFQTLDVDEDPHAIPLVPITTMVLVINEGMMVMIIVVPAAIVVIVGEGTAGGKTSEGENEQTGHY